MVLNICGFKDCKLPEIYSCYPSFRTYFRGFWRVHVSSLFSFSGAGHFEAVDGCYEELGRAFISQLLSAAALHPHDRCRDTEAGPEHEVALSEERLRDL